MARVYQDSRSPTCAGRRPWFVDYVDLQGQRHRERTPATTKMEAEAILRARLSEMAKATILGVTTTEATKRTTFAEFVDTEYLPHSQATKRPSSYLRDLTGYAQLTPKFGGLSLREITPGHVERYIVERLNQKSRRGCPPRPATVNRERALLCAVLTMAWRRGLIAENPVRMVRKLREDNARERFLSIIEERLLLRKCPGWLHPLVSVALLTGMRLGEILSMRWADVDPQRGMIRIPHAKNHKVRYVPILGPLAAVLNSTPKFTGSDGMSPFVFVNSETGKPFTVPGVSHSFKRAAVSARMDDVTFHVLRHTAVSRMAEAGVSDRQIMMLVGHSSPHMVSRYAHLRGDALKKAAEALVKSSAIQVGTNQAQVVDPGNAAM